jgi:putative transposase
MVPDAPAPDDEFQQLQLRFTDPVQHDYEVIRPVLLFGTPLGTRSEQTGLDRATVRAHARRFLEQGMLGLADQRPARAGRPAHAFPPPVARYLLWVKQLYPPITVSELVRIVARKFGYHTNYHTVKSFLARHEPPVQLPLRWTLFHEFEDAYQARWQVVHLHYEGWQIKSIAGVLQLSERHVRRILAAFATDDFAGLEDQRHRPPDHPSTQLTLQLLKEVRDLQQEYPKAGRFRLHGILTTRHPEQPAPSMTTVGRAMARNRAFHGAPPAWQTDARPPAVAEEPKHFPYRPTARHQYWFIDLRYLVRLNGEWIYSICIIEGYSRKILAGMASDYQDEVAVLQVLVGALNTYGCPQGIVSDNGTVFTAAAYEQVLAALEITPHHIEKGAPWENLIEAQFKVQLRLADAAFARAEDLLTVQAAHAAFVELFNTTPHWAHQDRADGQRTPVEVLGWVQGRPVAEEVVRRAVREVQWQRVVNAQGYISVQRFYVYAERGLARHRVAVWVYEGRLAVEYEQTVLARYKVRYARKQRQVQAVTGGEVYRTAYRSPQLELWELDEEQWQKVRERAARQRGRRQLRAELEQLPLWPVATLVLYYWLRGMG